MTTRAESAAQTRRALIDAAADLLEEGGAAAVTLRAVGERAGVSRGAPYGHFDGKAHLLAVLAAERWNQVTAQLAELSRGDATADQRLHQAVRSVVDLGIHHRATYDLMFTVPDERAELVAAAVAETQDLFIALVADAAQSSDPRRLAALIMAGAHGVAGMAANGHLRREKWGADAEDVVADLIRVATR